MSINCSGLSQFIEFSNLLISQKIQTWNIQDLTPEKLIDFLSDRFSLKVEFDRESGVWERYSNREHALRVLRRADKTVRGEFEKSRFCGLSYNDFRLFLALHDIGKGRGITREQEKINTQMILADVFQRLGHPPRNIDIFLSMVEYDTLGRYLREDINADKALQELENMAQQAHLHTRLFFDLFLKFYCCDAGSYESVNQALFEDGLLSFKEHYLKKINTLYSLLPSLESFFQVLNGKRCSLEERVRELYRNRHALILGKEDEDQLIKQLVSRPLFYWRQWVPCCLRSEEKKVKEIWKQIILNRNLISRPNITSSSLSIPICEIREQAIGKIKRLFLNWDQNNNPNSDLIKIPDISIPVLEKLAKIKQVRAILKDDYFVFTHGCHPYTYMTFLFYRELLKLLIPYQDNRYIVPMRAPRKLAVGMKTIMEQRPDTRRLDYAFNCVTTVSADAYLNSAEQAESALYYANGRVAGGSLIETRFKNGFEDQMKESRLPIDLQKTWMDRFNSLCKMLVKSSETYGLLAICVPKQVTYNLSFLAHKAGWTCSKIEQLSQDDFLEILERLQADEKVGCGSCGYGERPLQMRFFPERLTADQGVLILPFFDMDEQVVVSKIQEFTRDFYASLHTFNAF